MDLNVELTEEQDAALTTLAELEGLSKHDAAVQAILETAKRRRPELLDKSLDEELPRYADAIERLGH